MTQIQCPKCKSFKINNLKGYRVALWMINTSLTLWFLLFALPVLAVPIGLFGGFLIVLLILTPDKRVWCKSCGFEFNPELIKNKQKLAKV